MLAEDPLDQNFDLGASAFPQRPVNGDAFANLGDEFRRERKRALLLNSARSVVALGNESDAGDRSSDVRLRRSEISGLGVSAAGRLISG